ncbi:MAG: glycogen synthase [Clostridiaceae bacterium]|nr:glycogen synthase [Clostridiaceae bacterium]
MKKIKILFVSSEVAPYAKVGGLADVIGSLPSSLPKQNCEARVIMPLYQPIKDKYSKEMKFIGWKMVKMGWRSLYAGLYSTEREGVIHYFIDNEYYFHFDTPYVEYVFDIERFCFFQRAVLELIDDLMDFHPDVMHLNDWQCGMIPLLMDAHYRAKGKFIDIKTVFTVHNLKYQGIHGIEPIKDMMDLPDHYLTEELSLKDGAVNFLKAGIVYSNSVTTVSPTYAYEIMTDYYGEGLNRTLQKYAYKVSGILNGIDEEEYNPQTDRYIPKKFGTDDYAEGKAACKEAIQKQLKLQKNPGAPLCVMISRLVDQKGMDLLLRVAGEMLYDGMQLVVLGTGNSFYERAVSDLARQHPGKMAACLYFNNELAHLLYAGSDLFLMPSIFEPCGLSQMISMRYGTVPVVRETGGLKDTVKPYNEYTGEGNGFSFANINAHEFLFVTKYACDLYRQHKNIWKGLIAEGMRGDYSWKRSASEYMGLYSLITGIDLSQKAKAMEEIPAPKTPDPSRGQNQEGKTEPVLTANPSTRPKASSGTNKKAKPGKGGGTRK